MSVEEENKYKLLQCQGLIMDKITRAVPRKWTFKPTPDITPYELSLLIPYLMSSGTAAIIPDDLEYFERMGLSKYMKIEDAPEFKHLMTSISSAFNNSLKKIN